MSKSLAESGGAVSMCQVLSFVNEKEAARGAPSLSSGPQACERCKRFSRLAMRRPEACGSSRYALMCFAEERDAQKWTSHWFVDARIRVLQNEPHDFVVVR